MTVDKAVSTGVTLFDRKGATMSHKTTMRPLMRPDELGAMNETRCIIKLRNQQPIFGIRNFYYADKELQKRSWLSITKRESTRPVARPSDVFMEKIAPEPLLAAAGARPGAAFSKGSVTGSETRPPISVSCKAVIVSPPEQGLEQAASTVLDERSPDFKRALHRSADRRDAAEQSINYIMSVLDGTPAKESAVRTVRKNVAVAFAEE